MAVVKAFGYGSDVAGIAKKLVELGADYFAVAYTSEGIALREAGIEAAYPRASSAVVPILRRL